MNRMLPMLLLLMLTGHGYSQTKVTLFMEEIQGSPTPNIGAQYKELLKMELLRLKNIEFVDRSEDAQIIVSGIGSLATYTQAISNPLPGPLGIFVGFTTQNALKNAMLSIRLTERETGKILFAANRGIVQPSKIGAGIRKKASSSPDDVVMKKAVENLARKIAFTFKARKIKYVFEWK
jgi:hypothetical protein